MENLKTNGFMEMSVNEMYSIDGGGFWNKVLGVIEIPVGIAYGLGYTTALCIGVFGTGFIVLADPKLRQEFVNAWNLEKDAWDRVING